MVCCSELGDAGNIKAIESTFRKVTDLFAGPSEFQTGIKVLQRHRTNHDIFEQLLN